MEIVEVESGIVVTVGRYSQPHIVVAVCRDERIARLLPLGPKDDPEVVKAFFRIAHDSRYADAYRFADGRPDVFTVQACCEILKPFKGHM